MPCTGLDDNTNVAKNIGLVPYPGGLKESHLSYGNLMCGDLREKKLYS